MNENQLDSHPREPGSDPGSPAVALTPASPMSVSSGTVATSADAASSGVWRPRSRTLWREWVRPLLIIGFVMGSFRSAVADWNDVPTGSMKPTILEGDRIFINKVAYDLKIPFTTIRVVEWSKPIWGDVVVLRSPEDSKRLVKRVVGLPGDEIAIRNRRLIVNGRVAQYLDGDPFVVEQIEAAKRPGYLFFDESVAERRHAIMLSQANPSMPYGPITIPPDNYFVMGDNRDNSRDSRWFGPVHRELILGRATAVALSVDPENYYRPRWQRFFSPLR